MTDQHLTPKFIRDEEGSFLAEVTLSSSDEHLLEMDYSLGDDAVLLTVIKGGDYISLDMTPRDITALKETLDRCSERLAAEQEDFGADADGATDCLRY